LVAGEKPVGVDDQELDDDEDDDPLEDPEAVHTAIATSRG
jgi:hypothetical protein